VFRRLVPTMILFSALTPLAARAQVDIDQDKSPAHIFSSDCSVCHKSTRGLANGRSSSELTGFLVEHYTSSRQEAASVAAYVLAGGGGVGKPTPAHEEKPAADGDQGPTTDQPKSREARRLPKPDEAPAAGAKPARAANERGRHDRGQRTATAEPGVGSETKPPAEPREPKPEGRAHTRQKPAEAAPPTPEPASGAVAAAPMAAEPAKPENAAPPAPIANTPQQAEPAAAPAGERDNIPD
jgi:hypothetical protein